MNDQPNSALRTGGAVPRPEGTGIAVLPSLSDLVDEYAAKAAAVRDLMLAHGAAAAALETGISIGGQYGGSVWGSRGKPDAHERDAQAVLLSSAWAHVRAGLKFDEIAPVSDRQAMDRNLATPPPFVISAIRETFGRYLLDPRAHILRGLAEQFVKLDPSYKSHTKVRVGKTGLPKRVIVSNCLSAWSHRGLDQIGDILGAVDAVRGLARPDYVELRDLVRGARDGGAERNGITVKGYANGNAHLIFGRDALSAINGALAEYYGEVLPDADPDDAPRRARTDVAADLAYYPTPAAVISRVLGDVHIRKGARVLEPSCGDGRIMDAIRAAEPTVTLHGIEVHGPRAGAARTKRHAVIIGNFLDMVPSATYDLIVMNPPFAGQHWRKHLAHARRFLAPGGVLACILPATANYDGDDLIGTWRDLPVGSFAESGTNVPTGYLITEARRA